MITPKMNEDERVQYDGKDPERIKDLAQGVTIFAVGAVQALGNYSDVISREVTEDSAYDTKIARQELIEAWAFLNAQTRKMAWALRIDATEASKRFDQAIDAGEPVNMEGM